MDTTRRIAKNAAILAIAEIVTAAINLFFMTFAARYLGADGFGILSFALAIMAIFLVFTDIGLNPLTTREVARDKNLAAQYLGNIATLKVILSLITFGLISLTINLLHYPVQTQNVVYLIALYLVFNAFNTMFYAIFQAFERMEFVTLGRVLNSILLLGGSALAVSQGLSVTAFALAYITASVVTLACNASISAWKFTKLIPQSNFRFWKDALSQAWTFGLAGVFSGIYFWIDSIMLSLMRGNEVVGWYNAAYRLVFVLGVIPGIYFAATFPVMSKYYLSSIDSLKFMSEKSIKYMLILAVPLGVGTSLLAEKIIFLAFGPEFINSAAAIQVLIWAVALMFVSSGFLRLFESLNKQVIVTIVTGGCALLNVILNLILIPGLSYIGASIAALATQSATLSVVLFWSTKHGYGISGKKLMIILLRTMVATGVMGIFVYYLREHLIIWALVPLAALLYFSVLFAIRGIDQNDMLLLKSIRRQQTEPIS